MRLWLSKNSEVPLRDQLTTQIVLGIVSDDLKAGQRLPSTRELARRYRVHPNTVSAAYNELARRGWVELRKGSGIYVRSFDTRAQLDTQIELDQMIAVFLRVAREKGFSLADIRRRLRYWFRFQPPDHFLVIEPDDDLRKILIAEIEEAVRLPVSGARPEECSNPLVLTGAAPVALIGQGEIARSLPAEISCLLLHSRSVTASLEGERRPPPDALVSVASHWPDFLRWAQAVLVAAGVDSDALSLRSAREPGWKKGLASSFYVITDALTARSLPPNCNARVFRIIADSSIEELKRFEEFISRE
ncbi:MAG: GntR family transcriptional regulator [Acidobacteriota bacterium]